MIEADPTGDTWNTREGEDCKLDRVRETGGHEHEHHGPDICHCAQAGLATLREAAARPSFATCSGYADRGKT